MMSKAEIIGELDRVFLETEELIHSLSEEAFHAKPDTGKWSIAEEFYHILRSNVAFCSALKRKPYVYRWKFGRPNRPLREYEEAKARYYEKLSRVKGVVAPDTFVSNETLEHDAKHMLDHWSQTLGKLQTRINRWSDRQLNRTLLPHPLLGKMYVREFLYFTIFHSQHHLDSMRSKHDSVNANRQ